MTTLAGTRILLPTPHGDLVRHTLSPRSPVHDFLGGPPTSRIAYAAAHVVADPHTEGPQVDWDATLAFRRHLWGLGFGVADAMDTAQRGGGLGWADAKQLIARSGAEARAISARLVCGAMTDQLDGRSTLSLDDIVNAYLEQAEWIRTAGGTPVLMASRHLAQAARNADDYWHVYDRVLTQLDEPVILHWLGRDFDPVMATYWGSPDLDTATGIAIDSYHVWWDPRLESAMKRARPYVVVAQLADWLVPTTSLLTGRGLPGDGIADLAGFLRLLDHGGFTGPVEIEVLNADVWETPLDALLLDIKQRIALLGRGLAPCQP